jgi:membrane protease YdiL (CAAX protease family)
MLLAITKILAASQYPVSETQGDAAMLQNTPNQTPHRFAFQRPILFSILVIIISGLVTEIPFDALFKSWLKAPTPELLKVTIGHSLLGLILIWFLIKLGMLKGARFTHPSKWRAVWLVWPFFIFTLLNLDAIISGNLEIDTSRPGLILLFVFTNLAIGFAEEVMARGVVLNLMLQKWRDTPRGIYRAVVIAALLFGGAHIFNLLTGHLPPLAAITQVGYSIAFGVVFAACFLRNNSIWPVIIMHAAIDFAGGLRHISVGGSDLDLMPAANNTIEAALTSLIISIPLLLYGLYILRKVKPDEI